MMTDLQIKVEKYETKAAQCKEWVRQATDAPQRALYEVLANYYVRTGNGLPEGLGETEGRVVAATSSRGCEPL